jgi:hypothetical protein
MGNFIQGAKVGSIVRTYYHGQYFYIHNIHNDVMEMSGIAKDGLIFRKSCNFRVDEVVPPSEEHIFYDMLEKYRLELDLNKGVQRI